MSVTVNLHTIDQAETASIASNGAVSAVKLNNRSKYCNNTTEIQSRHKVCLQRFLCYCSNPVFIFMCKDICKHTSMPVAAYLSLLPYPAC